MIALGYFNLFSLDIFSFIATVCFLKEYLFFANPIEPFLSSGFQMLRENVQEGLLHW